MPPLVWRSGLSRLLDVRLILALAVAGLVAACGGSDSGAIGDSTQEGRGLPVNGQARVSADLATAGGGARMMATEVGSAVGGLQAQGAYAAFFVALSAPARYVLTVRYANADVRPGSLSLYVNQVKTGPMLFVPTGAWTTFADAPAQQVSLTSGLNEIRLQRDAENEIGADIASISLVRADGVVPPPLLPPTAPAPTPAPAPGPAVSAVGAVTPLGTLQASVGGGARILAAPSATIGSAIGYLHVAGAYGQWTVDAGPRGGPFEVSLRYANGNPTTANLSLYGNGFDLAQLDLPSTGSWNTFRVHVTPIVVNLPPGRTVLRLQRDADDAISADIDQMTLVRRGAVPAPPPVSPAPPVLQAPAGLSIPFVNVALIPPRRPGSPNRDVYFSGELAVRDAGGIGAARTRCTLSHFNFDDPLVFPGQPNATHLHMFFGNTGANYASTADSIATTGDGTCRGGILNRSAYWAPALINVGLGEPIVPNWIDVYYKTGYAGVRDVDVQPFPDRFRMIAGSSRSQGAQPGVVSYSCNGGAGQDFIPSGCTGVLTMSVRFPQCWDGRNLDSPDHQSHLRYPEAPLGCNRPGDVPLPEITIHIQYPVRADQVYRLSSDVNGSPAGSSGHADWIKGWEPEVMRLMVQRIINPGLSGGSELIGDGRTMTCGYPGCQ